MRKVLVPLLLVVMVVCGGCPLDSIFVREKFVHSKRPYVDTYKVPRNQPHALFWRDKEEFLTELRGKEESGKLSDEELLLLYHLYDYYDVFTQVDAAVGEYNRQAYEHNKKHGYEK